MRLTYRLTKTLAGLWCSAGDVYAEIQQFQPDMIVALYHGVQPLLLATQIFWQEQQGAAQPFPPVVRTNLGREKFARYDRVPSRLDMAYFLGFYVSNLERGHYLAWLSRQDDWLAALRSQVEAAIGATPAVRILVLDDMTYEGNSWLQALGLLYTLYPQAEIVFVEGGETGWRAEFVYAWLNRFHPDVFEPMNRDWLREQKRSGYLTYETYLNDLSLGTEDLAPESLDWRPLAPDGPTLTYLTRYLPAEDWLAIPAWITATTAATIRRWTQAGRLPDGFKCQERREQRLQLEPRDLIARELWLRRRLTAAEAAALADISIEAAETILASFLQPGFVERTGEDPLPAYIMRNEVGVLAYGSLLNDPGAELAPLIEQRIGGVLTPFAVEFARSSRTRAGAPTLVPVPDGIGARVQAQVLVLKPDVNVATGKTLLYRREIHKVGNADAVYDEAVQSTRRGAVQVRELRDFVGVPVVLYTDLKPNIRPVLAHQTPPEIKAQELARLAVASVTAETYAAGADGIRYLADALANGIETPLTPHYRAAVLALAGGAPDLETARAWVARQRGIS